MHAALGEQLGGRAVAPEQRHDERRAAVAARRDIERRSGVEQHPRHRRQVAVGGLVQRRPAVRVAARHVGAAVEQQRDEPLVAGRARHADQVVAVRPERDDEPGEAIEQLGQRVEIVRLDRAVGARERLAGVTQPGDVTAQRRPACEAVLARDDDPAPARVSGRVVARERRDRAVRAVLGGGEQPVRAVVVVVEPLVEACCSPGRARRAARRSPATAASSQSRARARSRAARR